jgi:hypothetical protein
MASKPIVDLQNELAKELGWKPENKALGKCVKCEQPFVQGVNIFTKAGQRETEITGLCEKCWDTIFADSDG